jgi:acetyltransferase-like isoleucine patch superfamily enzyme
MMSSIQLAKTMFHLLRRKSALALRFILPNYKAILLKRVNIPGILDVQQITLCTGRGKVHIGEKCCLGFKLGGFWRKGSIELQSRFAGATIAIGNGVSTNNNIFLCAANHIEIGDNTLIGQNVSIMDFEAHGIQPEDRRKLGKIGAVIIKKNCWIGNNVTILKNTELGENCIVATGAVVSGKFPDNVIIGGVPAKIIKSL